MTPPGASRGTQARRLGLRNRGVFAVFQLVQYFSALIKIADQLNLQSDWTYYLLNLQREEQPTGGRLGVPQSR